MASDLPLWYGRERGTDLIGFADISGGGDGADPEDDGVGASIVGTIVIAILLGIGVAVLAASPGSTVLTVAAGIASVAIVVWCLVAIAEVSVSEDVGTAAMMTVQITAGVGWMSETAIIIVGMALGIALILSLIAAASSDRR